MAKRNKRQKSNPTSDQQPTAPEASEVVAAEEITEETTEASEEVAAEEVTEEATEASEEVAAEEVTEDATLEKRPPLSSTSEEAEAQSEAA